MKIVLLNQTSALKEGTSIMYLLSNPSFKMWYINCIKKAY